MSDAPRVWTLVLACALAYGPWIHALALRASRPVAAAYFWALLFLVCSAGSLLGLHGPPPKFWRLRPIVSSLVVGLTAFVVVALESGWSRFAFGSALAVLGFRPLVELFWDERKNGRSDAGGVLAIACGGWVFIANAALVAADGFSGTASVIGVGGLVAAVALPACAVHRKTRALSRLQPGSGADTPYRAAAAGGVTTPTADDPWMIVTRGLELALWLCLNIAVTVAGAFLLGVTCVVLWWVFLAPARFG